MGDYNDPSLGDPSRSPAGTWGNAYLARGKVTIPAAAAIGETVDFIELPAGYRPVDASVFFDGAATASGPTSDLEVGLKGKTGTAQDDADFFMAASDLGTAGRNRAEGANPIVLDEAHYVRGTISGAAPGADTVVEVVVLAEYVGTE